MSCEKPFWNDPIALFTEFNLNYSQDCREQIWNFIARLFIISLAIGTILSIVYNVQMYGISLLIVIIVGTLIILTTPQPKAPENNYKVLPIKQAVTKESIIDDKTQPLGVTTKDMERVKMIEKAVPSKPKEKKDVVKVTDASSLVYKPPPPKSPDVLEKFESYKNNTITTNQQGNGVRCPDGNGSMDITEPTARNPFMNVLVDEYKYNPNRPSAASVSNPNVKTSMDDYFKIQWFSDPTDVFGRNQNQRQFITQPSTSVPNDRGSYQDWLYKLPFKTCKEGNAMVCSSGTESSPVVWHQQSM
jgi:hypothetical protein